MTARDFPILIQMAEGGFLVKYCQFSGKPANQPPLVFPNFKEFADWLHDFYTYDAQSTDELKS